MLFPTLSFAAFFAVVLPVSWLLMPHRTRWRLFMVGASWFFYGAADRRFVPLLAGSTVVNQFFAQRIHAAEGSARRNWTIGAVATNLGVLAWFKYIGFLSLTAQSSLNFLGVHGHVPLPEVLLPIGISFFTFQALSYVIDTSRGKIQPSSLLEFAVYLSFFPHLVAGPIVRATEFLPQIKEKIDPRHVDVGKAFWLISLGLFKKVVIASYLATYAADPLFGFPRQHAGAEALVGVYAYAIQIYADFSGYTDIAIGLALLLGIQFPQNFNAPYAATSLQDFWRRWHMTLSRWLRDYVYIPLGGNRRGRVRTYVNLMLTMLLGGLWHGAAWTFVAWGGLHGAGLAAERWWGERHKLPAEGKGGPSAPDAAPPPPASPAAAPTARRPKVISLARGEVITAGVAAAPGGSGEQPVVAGAGSVAAAAAPASSEQPVVAGAGSVASADLGSADPLAAVAAGEPGLSRRRSLPVSSRSNDPPPLPADATRRRGGAHFARRNTSGDPAGVPAGRPAPGAGFRRLESDPPATTSGPTSNNRPPALSPGARAWIGRLITFHLVCLAWIFFRATSFHNAIQVLGRIFSFGPHQHLNWKVVAVIVGALAFQLGPRGFGPRLQVLFSRLNLWYQALLLAGVLTVIDLLGPAGVAPFIYFRF
ncbi:MAG TPA: MBOAT family O-acyltransferase [Acidimicrobiales bacterium]|nr:MBOAT family O-acyltransferase [Acidimicrobiales bacterium]